jgi:hypothetical protein
MTKELYNHFEYNKRFVTEYADLFTNKIQPCTTIADYAKACSLNNQIFSNLGNLGWFSTKILHKYSYAHLFYLLSEAGGYEMVFRPEKDLHLWFSIRNMPVDAIKKESRYIVSPYIVAPTAHDILNFYNENQEFIVVPEDEKKAVGFVTF